MADRQADRQRVVVVTGGGGGIGAAIAEELGRTGAFVVTMDPLVTVDGSEQMPVAEETTAGRIVAAGGSARASSVSVTDAEAVRQLFAGLVAELGGLDSVVNVAGITRPTGFATGGEDDWLSVLAVHLDGYLNILGAALPIMAAAGHGSILGVTSGSGWRPANAGAYSCAKRAVASITWQLGRHAPPGVVINAMSPIAATRMVTAALSRARPPAASPTPKGSSATGGLSLTSMPTPEELGPLGAHLVDHGFSWCSGRVIFAGGSEVAVIDEPRLLEAFRTDGSTSLAHVLDAVTSAALVPAEASQATTGGSNSRFATIFRDEAAAEPREATSLTCAIVTDRADVTKGLAAALESEGITCTTVHSEALAPGFTGAADALATAVDALGPLDAVVVATGGAPTAGATAGWESILSAHEGIVRQIHADACWTRAVAELAVGASRAMRLVTLIEAVSPGGRSRAQAAAQLSRSARGATEDRVSSVAVSIEAARPDRALVIGELVSHLVAHPEGASLSGAELVVGEGWFGLRSHPRPTGSISFGGPAIPAWFDDTLRGILGEERP